ncbi:hypothetical protein [Micromonospora sp. NBC_01796]|uniref:hypothetical protein n=1 Tax=Micromonospora sp. NBC_01796 TaxID=2975987 RepID=UPI002DD8238B|nr:hypothetical protein [Micromonospora sp. NBC_01796]WSA88483.1 hypothetical protein OIE47_13255 [Micromonospora sp. NBC_01796]
MLRAPSSRTTVARRLVASGLLVGGLALAGCGTPPELRKPPGSELPSPATAHPTPTGTPVTPGTRTQTPGTWPTPTPLFGENTAVACQGKPTADQVVALLRRSSSGIPRGVQLTVPAPGPLCAGDWQYTVVQVGDRGPWQVVSKGPATALTLVTAGTDVCSIPVRTGAPAGIKTAACETPPQVAGGYTTPPPTTGA